MMETVDCYGRRLTSSFLWSSTSPDSLPAAMHATAPPRMLANSTAGNDTIPATAKTFKNSRKNATICGVHIGCSAIDEAFCAEFKVPDYRKDQKEEPKCLPMFRAAIPLCGTDGEHESTHMRIMSLMILEAMSVVPYMVMQIVLISISCTVLGKVNVYTIEMQQNKGQRERVQFSFGSEVAPCGVMELLQGRQVAWPSEPAKASGRGPAEPAILAADSAKETDSAKEPIQQF